MTINDIVNLLVNNGVAVGVIVYFMYYNTKQIDELKKIIQDNTEILKELKTVFEMTSDKLHKEEKKDE